MNGLLRLLALWFACTGLAAAATPTIQSVFSDTDPDLNTDSSSGFWRGAMSVRIERDRYGRRVPRYRTEVRTRWTRKNLYFLFICPYEELNLKPNPQTSTETNQLWNWDVAEVFAGADFKDIKRYREFEISPQGEWIDLDVN